MATLDPHGATFQPNGTDEHGAPVNLAQNDLSNLQTADEKAQYQLTRVIAMNYHGIQCPPANISYNDDIQYRPYPAYDIGYDQTRPPLRVPGTNQGKKRSADKRTQH